MSLVAAQDAPNASQPDDLPDSKDPLPSSDFFPASVSPLYGAEYNPAWCVQQAKALFNSDDVRPLAYLEQGTQSYSMVLNHNDMVQFRLPPFAADVASQARALFPEWVSELEVIDCPPFVMTRSTLLPGVTLIEYWCTRDMDVGLLDRVRVVATIIGRATRLGKPTTAESLESIDARLSGINHPELTTHVTSLRSSLHLLSTLPTTLTHTDLTPFNTLVDANLGTITGIIDWADAESLPFGAGLYAFDLLVGFQSPAGWHWREDKAELERAFWDVLWGWADPELALRKESAGMRRAVAVARDVGVLLEYAVRDGGSQSLVLLRALLKID